MDGQMDRQNGTLTIPADGDQGLNDLMLLYTWIFYLTQIYNSKNDTILSEFI